MMLSSKKFTRKHLKFRVFPERKFRLLHISVAIYIALTTSAQAYIGPGVGISLFGAVIGLLSGVALVCWGLVRYAGRRLYAAVAPASTQPAGLDMAAGSRASSESGAGLNRLPVPASWRGGLVLRLFYLCLGIAVATAVPQTRLTLSSWSAGLANAVAGFGEQKARLFTLPARFPEGADGVVTYDRGRAWRGLNLAVSATEPEARLFDMQGRELHRWSLPRDAITRAWAADGRPILDTAGLYWRRARALPDGSLLVVLSNMRTTPYGAGMMKLDWNSNVVWMNPAHYHHTLDVDEEGRIFTLYQEVAQPPVETVPWIDKPFLNEGVAILSPDGGEIERIGILDAFAGTPFESFLLEAENDALGDPIHMNTVDVLTPAEAARTNLAGPGDILVSMREMDTVAIIDRESHKVTWAASGLWQGQHAPELTGDNRLLLFDNRGPADGTSRAIEWDMTTRRPVWTWSGTSDAPLKSLKYGVVSELPNGNRLITESYAGRAIEVTRDGEVVWEWRSGRLDTYEEPRVANLMEVTRLPENYFGRRVVGHDMKTAERAP